MLGPNPYHANRHRPSEVLKTKCVLNSSYSGKPTTSPVIVSGLSCTCKGCKATRHTITLACTSNPTIMRAKQNQCSLLIELFMHKKDRNTTKKRWWLPSKEYIKNHKSLQFLGKRLHDPNLWHFTRYSTSVGTWVGLFICFIPLPIQMLLGAFLGIVLRANLLLS